MSTVIEMGIRSTSMRNQAEHGLKGRTTDLKKLPIDDVQKLVHELQIHQIELEMQNEELRRSQKELEDARNMYSDLFDFAPVGYFTFDKNGLILQVNLTGAKKLGIERTYLIKKPFSLSIAPDHKNAFYLHLREVFNAGKQMTCELQLVDNKGNIFDAKLESIPVHDSDGHLLCRTAMSDIKEQKRIRDALVQANEELKAEISLHKQTTGNLRESSLYIRKLIEVSLDPLVTISVERNITDVNKATEIATGISREQLIGSDFSDYFTEPEKAREGYQQVLDKGFVKDYPLAIKHISGKVTEVLYNATVYNNEAGEVQGIFAAARDITQLKRSEEERIQILAREHAALAEAQVARKLDQLKSMFIASTSHELRTPLNSIIGFSDMLLGGFSGELNPEQKKQLDIVHSAGKHLLLLISDVIDVSKIEAGKIDLHVSEVELRTVVDEAVSTLGANIKEKGLLLSVEVEKVPLRTDKMRLLQCIYNLIGNAVKYTEKGSIKIKAKTTGNSVDISVTDTGIGIKPKDIPKLFAPFVRLQTPLTEKTQGTGLGLYLVKKLSKEYLGGDVEVESEYGKGSKFTLNIPIELEMKG